MTENEDEIEGEGDDNVGRLDEHFMFDESVSGTDGEYEVEKNNDPKKKEDITDISSPEVREHSTEAPENREGSSDLISLNGTGNDFRIFWKNPNLNSDSSKAGKGEVSVTKGTNIVNLVFFRPCCYLSYVKLFSSLQECASCKSLKQDLDVANERLKQTYDKIQQQAADIQSFNQREKEGESLLEKMKCESYRFSFPFLVTVAKCV